ncbi:MAG: type 1 glutamine amidotransferase domain-containing protein [Lysobacter sp.]
MATVLMIVTNVSAMPGGDATGLWLEEFVVPYLLLTEAGHEVVLASPKGGATPVDPRSDEAEQHHDWAEAVERLGDTVPLAGVRAEDFAAVFIPGGHGPMFDLADNADVARLLSAFHRQGKPIASVCHGPAAFVGVLREDGKPLVEGYTLTAFSDLEEKLGGLDDQVPFLLSHRLHELGANVENSVPWLSHVKHDRQLITGQNPASSRHAAELLLKALGQA